MRRLAIGLAWWVCLLVAGAAPASAAEPLVVTFPHEDKSDTRQDFFIGILDLALSRTEADHGPYTLRAVERAMVQSRAVADLSSGSGEFSVLWTATTPDREQMLRAVHIPLDGGLLGYRIFVIRKDRAADFAAVRSLEDLKRFSACQGTDWPDRHILERAGFDVRVAGNYESLFRMLDAGRCDFFPRAIHEPWQELAQRGERYPDLMVEETLLLRYPFPIYFFVAPGDSALAERLEVGLNRAVADGGFHAALYGNGGISDALGRADHGARRIFDIPNPLLPVSAPLRRPELWYDPDRLPADIN